MKGRALDYKSQIDSYVGAKVKELRPFELSKSKWESIALITKWLHYFRDAMTQMSSTKNLTLSSTHAVFKGPQDELAKNLAELLDSAPSYLQNALVNSHAKLSDYFYTYDQSPYYIWTACVSFPLLICHYLILQLYSIRSMD